MSNAEIREIIPNNPKKALLIYKKLYPTLSMGAPKPEEVLKQWREVYGQSQNVANLYLTVGGCCDDPDVGICGRSSRHVWRWNGYPW